MSRLPLAFGLAVVVASQMAHSANPVVTRGESKFNNVVAPYIGVNTGAGATGYAFVSGTGRKGAHMMYCPPEFGAIPPSELLRRRFPATVSEDICYASEGRSDPVPSVTAQGYLDRLFGEGVAEVVSVGPVIVGKSEEIGVIYYRALTKP